MSIISVLTIRRSRRMNPSTGYYNKPRRRIRPRINKKVLFRGIIILLITGCICILSSIIFKALNQSVFFQIAAINIHGCRHTNKSLVLQLSGVHIHTNLLAMNVKQVKERIEAHGWIDKIEISRSWPNQLTITVKEKKPVAIINQPDGLYYLDKKGNAFAPLIPSEDMDYPIITGWISDPESPRPATATDSTLQEALLFLGYAGRGNTILPKQNISEIHITESGEIILFLIDRVFPIYLGKNNMGVKYNRLVKVLKKLYKKRNFSNTAYIRMDYSKDEVLVGLTESGDSTRG